MVSSIDKPDGIFGAPASFHACSALELRSWVSPCLCESFDGVGNIGSESVTRSVVFFCHVGWVVVKVESGISRASHCHRCRCREGRGACCSASGIIVQGRFLSASSDLVLYRYCQANTLVSKNGSMVRSRATHKVRLWLNTLLPSWQSPRWNWTTGHCFCLASFRLNLHLGALTKRY